MKYTEELQLSQIKELIYLECRKRGIGLASDPEEMDAILESGAELIILNHGSAKDPKEVLEWITEWISDTLTNFPNYFTRGEDYGL